MNTVSSIRKIFHGIAGRHDMFCLFDRHSQNPDREARRSGVLHAGEWFELGEAEHDFMFEILPPLWMRGEMFALREFLTAASPASSSRCRSTVESAGSTAIAICPMKHRRSACVTRSSSRNPVRSAP